MALDNVVVTGGCGYVGAAIVRSLIELHPECLVVILDLNPKPLEGTEKARIDYVKADITDEEDLNRALCEIKPQVVIHTAGLVPPLSERHSRRIEKKVQHINVDGTRNALKASRSSGAEAFVYTSSCCAVIDDMTQPYANIDERWPVSRHSSIYGESKVVAEALVTAANDANFRTCVIRPAVIYGEGDHQLVPSVHACIAKHETPYIIGDNTNLWDTVYVGNVGDAHVLAAENLTSTKTAAGEVFFIQNNEPISFREFCLEVWKNFGHYPPFEVTIPKQLGWVAGLIAEWWTWISGTPTTLSRGGVLDACAMRYASGAKAQKLLGYQPRVGMEEGLRRSCAVSV